MVRARQTPFARRWGICIVRLVDVSLLIGSRGPNAAPRWPKRAPWRIRRNHETAPQQPFKR
eukprot:1084612-Pyramimonas_sp.AAC.1